MRLHRFYTTAKLEHYVELRDQRLLDQWRKVLRFRPGQEVVLFDGQQHERLYSLNELGRDKAILELITDFERKTPSKEVTLFWSLLKKDKNDWVLQKATELGVSHFVPILAERSEKTGFNEDRAIKIVIEAAEQCGRSDIPMVHSPILLQTALNEYSSKLPMFVCEQNDLTKPKNPNYQEVGVLVGPEGGWSDNEKQMFLNQEVGKLQLGEFTLRAETASVTAAAKLLN
ncbi:MAG: RsmE family RNA methyltransferase [Candidatus Saccharimonadales bacterium]